MRSAKHVLDIHGIPITVYDDKGSRAVEYILQELLDDHYHLERIAFELDDVVIDVGAHIGLFAVYLAKRCPFLKIYAFEPLPSSFDHCRNNLRLNRVENVALLNKAVTQDGRTVTIAKNVCNTAAASAVSESMKVNGVVGPLESVTLDEIFESNGIAKCKLLKIDCEGMEYEVLYSSESLSRIEHLSAEFHHNAVLAGLGYQPEELLRYCSGFFSEDQMTINYWKMPD